MCNIPCRDPGYDKIHDDENAERKKQIKDNRHESVRCCHGIAALAFLASWIALAILMGISHSPSFQTYTSTWVRYPTGGNDTGIMVVNPAGTFVLGLPVLVSFVISFLVHGLVWFGTIETKSGLPYVNVVFVMHVVDDLAFVSSTYVDVAAIVGMTDAASLAYVVFGVFVSTYVQHVATSLTPAGSTVTTVLRKQNMDFWRLWFVASAGFFLPWIGFWWYYAQGQKTATTTTVIFVSFGFVAVGKFMALLRSFATSVGSSSCYQQDWYQIADVAFSTFLALVVGWMLVRPFLF